MNVLWTDLAAIALGVAALWAPGVAIERVWRGAAFGAMRPLAQAVLGLVVWYALTFTAAALGFFGRATVQLAATCGALAALSAILVRARSAPRDTRSQAPRDDRPGDTTGASDASPPETGGDSKSASVRRTPSPWHLGLIALLLAPHVVRSTSPVVSWDASTYHLTLARRLLERGTFPPVEWLFYGAWPQLVETLYAAAMAMRDHVLAKGLHAAFGALWLWTLMRLASARGARWAGTVAALAILASPIAVYELPIAYVDLAQAAFLSLSFAFGERAFSASGRRQARAALLIAGLAGGLLASSKLIGVGQAGLIGAGLLWRALRWRARHQRAIITPADVVLCYGAVAIALWLPWPIRSVLETGNPVFPLLTGWFGGPHWNPALGAKLAAWHAGIGMGRGPIDWLLLPWRVATQGGAGYDHFAGDVGAHWLAMGGLAVVGSSLAGPHRGLARRSLGLAAALMMFWAMTSQQARLLLPALGPLALAGGLGAATMLARLRVRSARQAVGAAVVVLVAGVLIAGPQRPMWREATQLAALKAQHGRRLTVMAMPRVARFLASRTATDARILLLHTNQAFWIGRDVIADSTFEASQIAAWIGTGTTEAEVAAKLTRAGVSHILSAPPRWRGGADIYPASLTKLAANPARCRPVFRDREHTVCALRAGP